MEETITQMLPITVLPNSVEVDTNLFSITKEKAFLSKHLRKYYLSVSSIYPKVIYKSFWIEEKNDGPLSRAHLKLKVTTLYPDIIGIEFAKTKTIYSKCHPRFIETLQGKGLLIMQQDTTSPLDETTAYVVELTAGQKAVVPPNWHYTLVNTGKETLATVELYQTEQELNQCKPSNKGSGVYVIERNGIPEIVKNSQYKNLAKYATVSAERYVSSSNLSTTESIMQQADVIANRLPELLSCNWKIVLDESGTGNYPF